MNIALLAVGKRGYHFAAFNLAASIKHFDPTANILLVTDAGVKYLHSTAPFAKVVQIDQAHTIYKGTFSPSLAKLNLHKYASAYFKCGYLYLDADNIALRSLGDFYDQCVVGPFLIGVEGQGGKSDSIPYSIWATNENIWSAFNLAEDATYFACHSDWWWAGDIKATGAIFKDAIALMGKVKPSDLRMKWGKTIPDELPLGAAISLSGIDPTPTFRPPAFLGNTSRTLAEIKADFPLLSMYGNGIGKTLTQRRYFDLYDQLMRKYTTAHRYKSNQIMNDKWINK